jgi:hypothetical protein
MSRSGRCLAVGCPTADAPSHRSRRRSGRDELRRLEPAARATEAKDGVTAQAKSGQTRRRAIRRAAPEASLRRRLLLRLWRRRLSQRILLLDRPLRAWLRVASELCRETQLRLRRLVSSRRPKLRLRRTTRRRLRHLRRRQALNGLKPMIHRTIQPPWRRERARRLDAERRRRRQSEHPRAHRAAAPVNGS